ncbi:AraC family transcriptional regulator [Pseudodesulfovibrio sp. JC047]|uniref:AraC family transcriptional regulator n=1 Tax=Pseudodesulfovibrio sp. JC047 TaxID=2683199 RepID=UPI0013D73DE9|nr:AraC family transcriptional regulator [Pseudodesulfovibrio sp. JC047]
MTWHHEKRFPCILPAHGDRGYTGQMTATHTVFKAEDMIDSLTNFQLWPFTEGTGCPVSDIREPHLHDYFAIQFVTRGKGVHVIDFQPYDIVPNSLYFVTPHQLHMWCPDGDLDGYVMAFTEDFLRSPDAPIVNMADLEFFYSTAHLPVFHADSEQASVLLDLVNKMTTEFNARKPGFMSVLHAFFHVFMVNMHRMYAENTHVEAVGRESDLVRRFKKRVAEKYVTQWTVQNYADDLGVSVSRLNSAVKESTGTTPGQVIRNETVVAAKRMLAHSDMNVSEICFELSFEDPSYFGRFFKREAGVTPSVFRNRMREKYQAFVR